MDCHPCGHQGHGGLFEVLCDVDEKFSDFTNKLVDAVPGCACQMQDAFDELREESEIAGEILVDRCAIWKSVFNNGTTKASHSTCIMIVCL